MKHFVSFDRMDVPGHPLNSVFDDIQMKFKFILKNCKELDETRHKKGEQMAEKTAFQRIFKLNSVFIRILAFVQITLK